MYKHKHARSRVSVSERTKEKEIFRAGLSMRTPAHVRDGHMSLGRGDPERRGGGIATAARVKTNQHKQRDDT